VEKMQRLNKKQKEKLNELLNSSVVSDYHKTLLKGIKGNNFNNVSIADNEILIDLFRRYEVD
jgi:hypothetical protein